MRVIGGLRFDFALGAPRFGATDRRHARGLCRSGRREGCSRCLRLRAGTLGMPRFAFAALVATSGGARLAFTAITTPGSSRLALAPRLAAAARTFPGTLA